jgi:hypothetical protein
MQNHLDLSSLPRSGLKLIIESLEDETIKQIAGQIVFRQSQITGSIIILTVSGQQIAFM